MNKRPGNDPGRFFRMSDVEYQEGFKTTETW